MSEVNLFNESNLPFNRAPEEIRSVITSILSDHGQSLEWFNVILLDDDQHTELNRSYLNHDYSTDVLTFDLRDIHGNGGAEVYINSDFAHSFSVEHNTEYEVERLIIHGCLHICGMEDHTDEGREKMVSEENKYLKRFM
ncbi:MAG: hypothetical protein Kow0075_03580 [Salibacteraceae bacterium]